MARRRSKIVVERLKSKEKGQINGLNVKHVLGDLSRAVKGTAVVVKFGSDTTDDCTLAPDLHVERETAILYLDVCVLCVNRKNSVRVLAGTRGYPRTIRV